MVWEDTLEAYPRQQAVLALFPQKPFAQQFAHLFAAGMLFGWETVMTFVLVSVVYAVAVGEPSFGVMGPFAVGLALFAMVFAGERKPFALAVLAFLVFSCPQHTCVYCRKVPVCWHRFVSVYNGTPMCAEALAL